MAGWATELQTRQATLGDAEERLADAEAALQEADERLQQAEQLLDVTRREGGERSEELHQAELRYSELSGRRRALRERLETEWRRPLEELLGAVTPLEVEPELLRTEAAELREQLEALGPVNPLAIEEHDEEVKRLDFLTTQRNDLAQARQSLQQAIREIDTTARELFLATFTQVRENFRQIFMTLFGGGECDLRLENPDQPLDCDIEIHASPRGKRTQRIHLLSSGERALVALSLLFGIFLTKPSPFCLLDEVDAPLDDQNIGRFVRMLNQFKSRTQFIVITHNPRTTTEAADAVYGVTMQEPGVSSLVSVRMRGRQLDEGADSADGAARPPARTQRASGLPAPARLPATTPQDSRRRRRRRLGVTTGAPTPARMRLTTVGTGTAAPSPVRVCSGHHVTTGRVRLLMDCGSGVVHRFAALGMRWQDITHLALTHFHTDHISDLATLVFAWRYGDLPARSAPVTIVGPAGTTALVERLSADFGDFLHEPGFPIALSRDRARRDGHAGRRCGALGAQDAAHRRERRLRRGRRRPPARLYGRYRL